MKWWFQAETGGEKERINPGKLHVAIWAKKNLCFLAE
jgi:hypothetical protein